FGTDPKKAPLLISGDTLFFGSIGRTDFKGGSMSDMRKSLKRLAVLPDATIVLPGHNDLTTIGAERKRVFAFYA
ncbi:MAG: MBL fold metallo-hydrolase, partial [Raoultibacter sp.]